MKVWSVPVALLVVGLTTFGAGLGDGTGGPAHDPCQVSCEVPAPVADDPAFPVPDCADTHDKGPCSTVWDGTDGRRHWWYVETGHTLYDGSARDLGVVQDM